jgi:hypothetical protein
MSNSHKIKRHMEVIGADGVHIGAVDGVEDGRSDSPSPTAVKDVTKAIITLSIWCWSRMSKDRRCACRRTGR